MHMSLDGFVAGPNGEMDWIRVDQEVFDYIGKRVSQSDSALYGRNTFQMMESYWPTAGDKPNATQHDIEHARWYNRIQKVVLSATLKDEGLSNTKIIRDPLPDRFEEIKQQAGEEILLFGSPTATHSLMQQDLIDGFWLFVNPIILGQGISLFEGIQDKIKLHLSPTTRQFSCGVTELNYTVDR